MSRYSTTPDSAVGLINERDWPTWLEELQNHATIHGVWHRIDPQSPEYPYPPEVQKKLPVYADARVELRSAASASGEEQSCSDILAYLKMMRDDFYWEERKAEAEQERLEQSARLVLRWINDTVHPSLKNKARQRIREGRRPQEAIPAHDYLRAMVKELKYMAVR